MTSTPIYIMTSTRELSFTNDGYPEKMSDVGYRLSVLVTYINSINRKLDLIAQEIEDIKSIVYPIHDFNTGAQLYYKEIECIEQHIRRYGSDSALDYYSKWAEKRVKQISDKKRLQEK